MVRRQMRVRDRGLKERSMKTCCERNAVDSSDFLVGYDGFQGIQLVASELRTKPRRQSKLQGGATVT